MSRLGRSLSLILILCTCCPPAVAGSDVAAKPNFVVIMADDMGYGDSSAYEGWIRTPHLERMAREGFKFTDFHSSGVVCSPTRAGLMTGRYQQRAGIPGVVNADPAIAGHHHGLQPSEITFAELLQKAGYRTAIFGKWHLGYAKKYNPLHHGFQRFRGFVSGNIDYISHYDRMETYDWWEGLDHVKEEGYLTHLLTQHAVRFIGQHRNDPFLLYVAHGAVHTPIQAADSPPGRGPDKQRAANDGRDRKQTVRLMMNALDDSIGEILDAVQRAGIADNTFVLFFSDNGGAKHMRNTPLRGGKGNVWEGGHRVPAIAWWPGRIKGGEVSDQLSISLDVMPTLLDLAGVRRPVDRKLDGVSLVPLLLEGKSLGTRQLFWNGTAMRDGPWKLVTKAPGLKQGPALYNLVSDMGERTNLAERHPNRVRDMTAAIQNWKQDVATAATSQPPAPDKKKLKRKDKNPSP